MAPSAEKVMASITAPFDGLVKIIKRRSLMVIVVSLMALTSFNIAVMADLGGMTQSRAMTVFFGMLIVLFTVLLLLAIYFEYKKRFPTRVKETEDIICRDCTYFAGKTILCEGCARNPYEKRGEKFDILESI
jgi:uncharacterized paraquat-inducible protein A